jgi:hypothetical protein
MRAVLVFCEGNHDITFAIRSLGALAGVTWLGGPISSLPSPFGPRFGANAQPTAAPMVKSFITERMRRRPLDGLRLMDAAHPSPPSFQALVKLESDDVVYAFLKSGGDDAADAAIDLIGDLLTQLAFDVDISAVAAAFLFDADQAGVSAREGSFAVDYAALLAGGAGPSHGAWGDGSQGGTRVPMGIFVFHDPATQSGTLEDVIGPLVGAEWPDRWAAAGDYLTAHQEAADPVAQKASEALKAQVCITGQFRFPGDPMTQVLGRDGLPKAHFQGPVSQALVDFLRRVPW